MFSFRISIVLRVICDFSLLNFKLNSLNHYLKKDYPVEVLQIKTIKIMEVLNKNTS